MRPLAKLLREQLLANSQQGTEALRCKGTQGTEFISELKAELSKLSLQMRGPRPGWHLNCSLVRHLEIEGSLRQVVLDFWFMKPRWYLRVPVPLNARDNLLHSSRHLIHLPETRTVPYAKTSLSSGWRPETQKEAVNVSWLSGGQTKD